MLLARIGGGEKNKHFNLPDLRARFLRGVDGGAKRDLDRSRRIESNPGGNTGDTVGTIQLEATKLPQNKFTIGTNGKHTHSNGISLGKIIDGWGDKRPFTNKSSTGESGDHSHVISGGDKETRPENAYVHWIIKVK